jgi:lysozyme family protein
MLGYNQMWDEAELDSRSSASEHAMRNRLMGRQNYDEVRASVGVPLLFLIPIHEREASGAFSRHLHNGDPLTARTVHVPAGRPKSGNPPFAWSESAADALRLQKVDKVTNWSIERVLYEQHRYNGITSHASSYVFAGTQFYKSGMWVADHQYDPIKTDPRPGTLMHMKMLIKIDPTLAEGLTREPVAPKEVINSAKKDASKTGRMVRNGTAGAGGVATGTQVSTDKGPSNEAFPILPIGIGICAAVFTLAAIYVIVKEQAAEMLVHKLWSGK